MPEFRSVMVCYGNCSESKTFVSASKATIERTFDCAKECQLSRAKPE